jgi:hypothetical protein
MATEFGNRANVISGPCLIYVDDGTGERNVGLTRGDVEFTIKPDVREQKFHQYGETPVGYKLQGMGAIVKFSAAEYTIDNLRLAMPWTTLYTDGANQALGHGAQIGLELSDEAVMVRVHPINKRGTDGNDDPTYLHADVTFWKGVNMKETPRKITPADDKLIDIELQCIIDSSKPANYNVCIEGDPDVVGIDVAPPTVASVKAEISDVLTLVPADDAGLVDIDAASVIEVIIAEEIKSWMAVQKYITLIKDSDKSIVAGAYVHEVVTGTPDTSKITFTPTSSLTAGAVYQVLIGGLQDISGNTMAGITQRKVTVHA